jgi:hypothetical protein
MPRFPNLPVPCHLCTEPITEPSEPGAAGSERGWWTFTWDHVIPKSLGGSDDDDNLRPAHLVCNIRRKNTPLATWRASRRWETPPQSKREKVEPLPRPCLVCKEPIERPRAMQLLHRGECTVIRERQLTRERRQAAQQRFGGAK